MAERSDRDRGPGAADGRAALRRALSRRLDPFDLAEKIPGRRFRSRIDDPSLPFGDAWTIDLEPEGGATRVRIEERGFVTHPVYRFFAALVFGHERTMKVYLADLQRAVER